MQSVTSIAKKSHEQADLNPLYLILGSTPDVELSALVDVIRSMGGQEPSSLQMQRWKEASAANAGGAIFALEDIAESIDLARNPVVLPIVFDTGAAFLHRLMEHCDKAALLLFYGRPELYLIKALDQGKSPRAALEEWSSISRTLLEVVHRHRERAVLFNAESALTPAAGFRDICLKRFGLKSGPSREQSALSQLPDRVPEIHRLIAAQMVVQAVDVQWILDELEATAEPSEVVATTPEVDCENALAEWRARSNPQESSEAEKLRLLQIHRLQEELERHIQQLRIAEQDLAFGKAEIERLSRLLADKDRKYKAAHARTRELKQQLSETHRILRGIRGSWSWRLTSPLRYIRGVVRSWFKSRQKA